MQRRKKQLLGAVGLAGVMAMTAIACSMPAPDASAQSGETTITVVVENNEVLSTQIISPKDTEMYQTNVIPIRTVYQGATELVHSLSCRTADGSTVNKVIDTLQLGSRSSGTREFEYAIDTSELGVQADCVLTATAKGPDNGSVTDQVSFRYRSLVVEIKDEVDENRNPLVHIDVSDDVYVLTIQVYDEHGNPVFVDKDGKPKAIQVERDQFDLENMSYELYLPMSEYGAKAGKYSLAVVAYGEDRKTVISMNLNTFEYKPETPEVPGTGSVFDDLNISRMDYLLTGLIAFGAVAGFAIYLMLRKSRH